MVTVVEVFDPPMCCSTGICGPDPQPELAAFAADLKRLGQMGIQVRRYNLGQDPIAFADNPSVKRLLDESDGDGLPVILADGEIFAQGFYPDWNHLSRLVDGMALSEPDPEVAEARRQVSDLVTLATHPSEEQQRDAGGETCC